MTYQRHVRTRLVCTATAVALLALTGCATDRQSAGPNGPGATSVPGATASPSDSGAPAATPVVPGQPGVPTPTGNPGDRPPATPPNPPGEDVLSPAGLGPFIIGTTTAELREAGLIGVAQEMSNCPDLRIVVGRVDDPDLIFHREKLRVLSSDSPFLQTMKGARVGMTLAQVKAKHPVGQQLGSGAGRTGWLVTEGGNALLFRLTSAGVVERIEAGAAQTVRDRFTSGEDC